MNYWYLIILFLCPLAGTSKEYPEEYSSLLTDKLLHELEKRLMDYSDSDEQGNELYSNSRSDCTFDVGSDTIIKTKVSLEQGAEFLDSPSASSQEECKSLCCQTDDCNLAVFKEKVI